MKKLHTEHEPYSLDLLNYEIAQSLTLNQPPMNNRFSGRRVQANSAKRQKIKSREKRLRKFNLSVMYFAS
jgi:hypothetical protein